MTDYLAAVRAAIGKEFGNYDNRAKEMEEKFNSEKYYKEHFITDEGDAVRENIRYFTRENNTEIATAFSRKFNDGTVQYNIWDGSEHKLYNNSNSVEFTSMTVGYESDLYIDYIDTNGNGYVDEKDSVKVNQNGKWSLPIVIKKLLAGRSLKFDDETSEFIKKLDEMAKLKNSGGE